MSIRDRLVLPNCESICIPWMLAEKEDWVPRSVAPFIWIKQESASGPTTKQGDEKLTVEANRGIPNNYVGGSQRKSNEEGRVTQPKNESSEPYASSVPADHSTFIDRVVDELTTPLLKIDEKGEISYNISERKPEWQPPSQSLMLTEQQNDYVEDDDSRPKRIGTRARVLGFRKKMGEKLEEKRRHIEERGRHIVERMKGPQ